LSLTHPFAGESFDLVDPSFCVFDETVKVPSNKTYEVVDSFERANNDEDYDSWYDLSSPRQKAEALLPILAITSLRLNSSSTFTPIVQIIFARMVFVNRMKLVPFSILKRNSNSALTHEVKVYLHGRRLMDMIGPPEEAFIRFVNLVDLVRYHPQAMECCAFKYDALFTEEERDALVDFVKEYKGDKNDNNGLMHPRSRKVFKGFRTTEIDYFSVLKGQVVKERSHVSTVIAEMDSKAAKWCMERDGFPPNRFNISPFPEVVGKESIKIEKGVASKKENTVNEFQAMACDDDDFDYFKSRF
jgi:hypothetical protein